MRKPLLVAAIGGAVLAVLRDGARPRPTPHCGARPPPTLALTRVDPSLGT